MDLTPEDCRCGAQDRYDHADGCGQAVDLTPEADEDQERSELEVMSFATKALGQQRTMAKALVQIADALYEMGKAYEALELDVDKIRESAHQAGREDAARPMIDPADVKIVLDQRIGHDHQQPAVWDLDNPPDRAGQPCVECAARKRLRAAVEGVSEGEG